MSDAQSSAIGPVPPVSGTPVVQPVQPEPTSPRRTEKHAAAETGGALPGAYAQLVINADTHDVVIRIRDATTDQVVIEYPSSEVEHMAMYLKQYMDALARRRAAGRYPSS